MALLLSVFLMGCSASQPVVNEIPARKPLNLPPLAPLVLKPVDGNFVVGETKETSTYVLSFKGYNDFLTNNKIVSNRLELLSKRIILIQNYYSKP